MSHAKRRQATGCFQAVNTNEGLPMRIRETATKIHCRPHDTRAERRIGLRETIARDWPSC